MLAQLTQKISAAKETRGEPVSSSQWVDTFAQQMRNERRVRASTLEAYKFDLAMLARWAATENRGLLELTGADLTRYIRQRHEKGTQPSTLGRQLSSWRCFYSFLVNQGALADSPAIAVHAPRVPGQAARRVPDDVLGSLLQAGFGRDASPDLTYRARRDQAMVWTLYATGLGISDVRLLRWPQMDEKLLTISVPVRNGPARSVLLDARSLAVLRALRSHAARSGPGLRASSYCFPTASGLPMSRQALCHVVHKWAWENGSKVAVTPSMLRQVGREHQAERRHRELKGHRRQM